MKKSVYDRVISLFKRGYIRKKALQRMMRFSLAIFLTFLVTAQWLAASSLNGQHLEAVKVTLRLHNESLIQAFEKIEKQTSFRFMYRKGDVRHIRNLSCNDKALSLDQLLNKLLLPHQLSYTQVGDRIMVLPAIKHTVGLVIPDTEPADAALPPLIKGKVTDEKGDGLPGVSILVKGTTQGTVTDGEGNFALDVASDNAVLVFSFVGYVGQEIAVGNRTSLEVRLLVDEKALEEVVVVGYGVQKKTSVTAAVSTMKGEEIASVPVANLSNSLGGRLPGLIVR